MADFFYVFMRIITPKISLLGYAVAVSTVQPFGIPLTPVVVQLAAAFFTNVPFEATPFTQLPVYVPEGVVVNIAFM